MENQVEEDPIVITSAIRTPIGNFQGSFITLSATDLGAIAIKEAVAKANISSHNVQAVIMGCVLTAGLGQAPARQAAIKAQLPVSTDCTTVNKVCGSGMKSIMFAHAMLSLQSSGIFVAGGMESMTNAPYLLPKARIGYRLGHYKTLDHILFDGLEDAYEKGSLMGKYAETCANKCRFSREEQDAFARASLDKAIMATSKKIFAKEIAPVVININEKISEISVDDGPITAKPEKIPLLRPAFVKDGTITAANSSSISDGAAAVTLMKLSQAKSLGIRPIAKIISYVTHSQEPSLFTTAPIYAIRKLLEKLNWKVEEVDLWEINEAFAVVVMAAIKELNLPAEKVNVHGGGCVLGHPIGATGARIVVTLINALNHYQLKKGIAALCIGGGEATALAVEMI